MFSCGHRTTLHRNEQAFGSEAPANKVEIYGLRETAVLTLLGPHHYTILNRVTYLTHVHFVRKSEVGHGNCENKIIGDNN